MLNFGLFIISLCYQVMSVSSFKICYIDHLNIGKSRLKYTYIQFLSTLTWPDLTFLKPSIRGCQHRTFKAKIPTFFFR